MKICYVVCIWILLTEIRVSSTDGIEIYGYSGKYAIVSCAHSWASTNRKYFCRDPCNHKDILVSSDQSPNGRFRLEDFGNGSFTVTISDLQESDSGIYWCGVDRVWSDTYLKVILKVYKEMYTDKTPTSTKIDTTQPLPTPTRQPESLFTTSSRTSKYSTPDDITSSTPDDITSSTPDDITSSTPDNITNSPSAAVSVNILLYAVGGVIAVIVFLVGLVAVHLYRKRVKSSTDNVPVTSINKHNECTADEGDNVYENDLQDAQNSKQIKSKKLKPEVPKRKAYSVYQNVKFNTGQSDVIYGNLDPNIK